MGDGTVLELSDIDTFSANFDVEESYNEGCYW